MVSIGWLLLERDAELVTSPKKILNDNVENTWKFKQMLPNKKW